MAKARAEVKPCEICGDGAIMPYRGHMLCSYCKLYGCGDCFKATMEMKRPWFLLGLFQRYRCPNCHAKGPMHLPHYVGG